MSNAIRLSGPCQAGTARIDEPWKRGAIDSGSFDCVFKSIAESSTDPNRGIDMSKLDERTGFALQTKDERGESRENKFTCFHDRVDQSCTGCKDERGE